MKKTIPPGYSATFDGTCVTNHGPNAVVCWPAVEVGYVPGNIGTDFVASNFSSYDYNYHPEPDYPKSTMDCTGAWIADEDAWRELLHSAVEQMRARCEMIAREYADRQGGWVARRIAQNIADIKRTKS